MARVPEIHAWIGDVLLNPYDRYAFVGKTRSGKTALAMVFTAWFARVLPYPWEIWWIDTKADPDDIRALRQWGFRNGQSKADMQTTRLIAAKYFLVRPTATLTVVAQVQWLVAQALKRRHVIIVIDEYTQVVPSRTFAGAALLDLFQRGGGLRVGVVGLTQEPVYVPRQLLSQATHQVLFNLSYDYDIQYIQKIDKNYVPPADFGDVHGFYWKWVDGPTKKLMYYAHQADWFDSLQVQKSR